MRLRAKIERERELGSLEHDIAVVYSCIRRYDRLSLDLSMSAYDRWFARRMEII